MNIKPILFNTVMVRAIIDGRKTQTRRAIKPQPTKPRWNNVGWLGWDDGHGYRMKPPCEVDDVLWVRETFTQEYEQYYFRADFESDWLDACETLSGGYPYECAYHPGCEGCGRSGERIRWSPSIHMPKEAARIFLHVTDIRVERLGSMTEEDAIAEGFFDMPADKLSPLEQFANIWDETIKRDDLREYGYHTDPWVWVIEFERCKKPEGWSQYESKSNNKKIRPASETKISDHDFYSYAESCDPFDV